VRRKTTVVGLGYVGLPLALLAKQKGHDVIGIDYNKTKVKMIQAGTSPFIDKEIDALMRQVPLQATTAYTPVEHADTIVVCVPTPIDDACMPDLTPVITACTQIAKHLGHQRGQLVVIESTINPGICEEVVLPILEKQSHLRCGKDFYLAHCPERINPGDTTWNVRNIPRVVGGFDEKSLRLAMEFYESVIDAPIKAMQSLKEAEAVKVVENSFRDINIAFVNELAMSFTRLNIDVVNVIQGASTKPFSFMPHFPGVGVGGHCIPVDPYYLIEYARKNGFTHNFLSTARSINSSMPRFTVERLQDALESTGKQLPKAHILVLGLSYKPDVGDLRESPALKVIDILQTEGAHVTAYDPYINHLEGVHTVKDNADTLEATLSEAFS
jgi:UDP-N-acetyl-D-glucosamine dehydrogenase